VIWSRSCDKTIVVVLVVEDEFEMGICSHMDESPPLEQLQGGPEESDGVGK
jgi:hypothetical protein